MSPADTETLSVIGPQEMALSLWAQGDPTVAPFCRMLYVIVAPMPGPVVVPACRNPSQNIDVIVPAIGMIVCGLFEEKSFSVWSGFVVLPSPMYSVADCEFHGALQNDPVQPHSTITPGVGVGVGPAVGVFVAAGVFVGVAVGPTVFVAATSLTAIDSDVESTSAGACITW
jgi:hypothetical protein